MEKYIRRLSLIITVFFTVFIFSRAFGEKPYYTIVRKMGYDDVSSQPVEIAEVVIPAEFNKVYQHYNNLLKEGGYDLTDYRGKKCLRYTYLIPSINARANILVYDGEIIGGDVSGITLDGIMIPIKKET